MTAEITAAFVNQANRPASVAIQFKIFASRHRDQHTHGYQAAPSAHGPHATASMQCARCRALKRSRSRQRFKEYTNKRAKDRLAPKYGQHFRNNGRRQDQNNMGMRGQEQVLAATADHTALISVEKARAKLRSINNRIRGNRDAWERKRNFENDVTNCAHTNNGMPLNFVPERAQVQDRH